MKFTLLSPQARKVAAVGIAALILSTLAHAQSNAPVPPVNQYNIWISMIEQSSDMAAVVDAQADSVPPGSPLYGLASQVDQIVDVLPGVDAGEKPNPPAVPEANAGLVLIPVVAAMLFFSMRRLRSTKTAVGTDG